MSDRVVVLRVTESRVTVEVPPEKIEDVVKALRDVVEAKSELRTITGVRYGLGFQLPRKYAEEAHAALFGPAEAVGDVVVDGGASVSTEDTNAADANVVDDTPVPEEMKLEEPPRSGRGSGETAWVAFLEQEGVAIPEGATRDDLIEQWDAHRNV